MSLEFAPQPVALKHFSAVPEGAAIELHCGDDRGEGVVAATDQAFHELPAPVYLVGGLTGLLVVLRSAQAAGSFGHRTTELHEDAELVMAEAANYNVKPLNHPGCAAREGAAPIGKTISLMPTKKLHRYAEEISQQQLNGGTVRRAQMHLGSPDNYHPLTSVKDAHQHMRSVGVGEHAVEQAPHTADGFAVAHGNVAYDIKGARADGTPRYGSTPELLAQTALKFVSIYPAATEELIVAGTVAWTAGVMQHLPPGGDESRAGIHHDYEMQFGMQHVYAHDLGQRV